MSPCMKFVLTILAVMLLTAWAAAILIFAVTGVPA